MLWALVDRPKELSVLKYSSQTSKSDCEVRKVAFFDVSEGVFAGISVRRLTRNKLSRLSLGRTALFDMVHPRRDVTWRRHCIWALSL